MQTPPTGSACSRAVRLHLLPFLGTTKLEHASQSAWTTIRMPRFNRLIGSVLIGAGTPRPSTTATIFLKHAEPTTTARPITLGRMTLSFAWRNAPTMPGPTRIPAEGFAWISAPQATRETTPPPKGYAWPSVRTSPTDMLIWCCGFAWICATAVTTGTPQTGTACPYAPVVQPTSPISPPGDVFKNAPTATLPMIGPASGNANLPHLCALADSEMHTRENVLAYALVPLQSILLAQAPTVSHVTIHSFSLPQWNLC